MQELINQINGLLASINAGSVPGIIKGSGQLLITLGDIVSPFFGPAHAQHMLSAQHGWPDSVMDELDKKCTELQTACNGSMKVGATAGPMQSLDISVVLNIVQKVSELVALFRGMLKPKTATTPPQADETPGPRKKK